MRHFCTKMQKISKLFHVLNIGVFLLWFSRLSNGFPQDSRFSLKTNLEQSIRSPDEVGIILAAKIFESVCWLDYLKIYQPKTQSLAFNQCHGQGNFQRDNLFRQKAHEKYFGRFLLEYGMNRLPSEYLTCTPFLLEDRHRNPAVDYSYLLINSTSDILLREATREGYPFAYKAFFHCMIDIVNQKHKQKGLQIMIERLTKHTGWDETMLQRENEFRRLHHVQPLVINDELTERAQKWANQLSRDCQMYHIHSSHPDYFLNESRQGENLFTGDNIRSPKEDMALFGTNIWYEEIDYYPWPEYKGYGEDPFLKFAHFSQMIWGNTEMVGYGYAINDSANCGQYFIVSRYFPPGNFYDKFAENVFPLNYEDTKRKQKVNENSTKD